MLVMETVRRRRRAHGRRTWRIVLAVDTLIFTPMRRRMVRGVMVMWCRRAGCGCRMVRGRDCRMSTGMSVHVRRGETDGTACSTTAATARRCRRRRIAISPRTTSVIASCIVSIMRMRMVVTMMSIVLLLLLLRMII